MILSKECLLKTLKKNEEVKGKIEAFNSLHDSLLEELEKSFPHEFHAYRKPRDRGPN